VWAQALEAVSRTNWPEMQAAFDFAYLYALCLFDMRITRMKLRPLFPTAPRLLDFQCIFMAVCRFANVPNTRSEGLVLRETDHETHAAWLLS
jgi:hypothetical protein